MLDLLNARIWVPHAAAPVPASALPPTPDAPASACPTLVFGHGYGCDQSLWLDVASRLPETRRVLFDWPGAGPVDLRAYDPVRHARLDGYADDLLDLLRRLDLRDAVYVGHSIGCSVGILAASRDASRLRRLILLTPSPRFQDDLPGYRGGFSREQLDTLVQGLADSHADWSRAMAPVIMGAGNRPGLAQDLERQFCAMDPAVAVAWGRATFFSDVRAAWQALAVPTTSLLCRDDVLVPPSVGDWLRAHLPANTAIALEASGHCPQVSAPDEVVAVLRAQLGLPAAGGRAAAEGARP